MLLINYFSRFSSGRFFLVCFFNPDDFTVKDAEDAINRVTLTI